MSMYDDMQASQVSATDVNADLMVSARELSADFGVPATDNADAYGIDQNLSATLQSGSNAAKAMAATASAVAGAGRTLTNVDAQGSRLGGVKESVGDQAKQTFAAWMKQRPEAAWRFLKNQTQPAWEPAEDASEASEGYDALKNGAENAVDAPGKVKDAYRKHQSRKEAKIEKKEGLAARNDRKADRHDRKIEKIADKRDPQAVDRIRLRHHAKRSEKLRLKADKQRAWAARKRRKKTDAIASAFGGTVSRRGFLIAAGGAGAFALSLMMLPSCISSVVVAIAGSAASSSGSDSLSSVENIVATFFLSKGLDELHTAAIMGNMKAESNMIPGNVEGWNRDCSDVFTIDTLRAFGTASGYGVGLSQWDGDRRVNLLDYVVTTGEDWYDTLMQLDFFWDHDEWGTGWHGSNSHGYWSEEQFLATDDLEEAVKNFAWGWERCDAGAAGHIDARISNAQSYYSALLIGTIGGTGEEYDAASPAQKRVADACRTTTSPGKGWCAGWVSLVMENAGFSAVSGNACDMYRNWCTSSNRAELKVGMIIAVSKHNLTDSGAVYGHVGIYVGDGKVMHNVGPIETMSLDRWIDDYGTVVTPRWGWANGIDLSTRS